MSTINERFGISLGERYDIHSLKKFGEERMDMIRKKTPTVLIWNLHYEAYWRPDGGGYTKDSAQAGIYTFDNALYLTWHVGKEHRIELVTITFKQ